ncbi:Calcium influx-promoting protein ehs1 [Tolypocladium ophioglossoides CBS 100239]|uniref:Calcium influx-promoting protein ehs1 n=1 Tax=Tolypocladium ophioglossoides (strain CBS 100239) TaxID=1163406 RepID=A0A0L0NIK0_TOLOC|nr:Calcium influx-promoting protein ehs1 [Tolypocladium ophioglossoides CBS 100239]
MQLSPLQSRLAASLAASLFLLALYLLLFSPNVALAAELPVDSYELGDAPHEIGIVLQGAASYEPEFDLFDRSIIGRAPPGVATLENNKPKALNLQPGTTACYMVEKSTIFGNDGSGNARKVEGKKDGSSTGGASSRFSDKVSKTLYLSANACLQPHFAGSNDTKSSPPQLILSISNSTEDGCQKPSNDPKDAGVTLFEEGAAMYSLNATGDIYVGITAPNVSSDFQGVYNFEVAASLTGYFHWYQKGDAAELLWMDSDSTSALLVTRNLTENEADIRRIMDQEPPYELFVSKKDSAATNGLKHSACGLQHTAQITANNLSNSQLNSPVRTGMTLRGPGSFPKQQFYFVSLNASSSYTGTLVKKSNVTAHEKREVGDFGLGSVVFEATEFQTVSATNCKVVTDLEFCNEIQYAVPGNDKKFNSTALAKAYDDYAKNMYANFETVMMQIPCEASRTSLYSLARNCDDCKAAYKKWLCTVSIPRCEDFASSNQFALTRNAGQAFPNGTQLPDDVRNPLVALPYSNASRNTFIDSEIQPGPYKEVLPCEDICYEVVQSCPAKIGFNCPRPHLMSFAYSYGQRDTNGSTVSCNYPGEARTPMSAARNLLPDLILLSGVSTAAAMMLG